MNIFAPLYSQNPFLEEHGIYNFGKGLPALQNYEFRFLFTCVGVDKFLNIICINSIHPFWLHPRAKSYTPILQGTFNLHFFVEGFLVNIIMN